MPPHINITIVNVVASVILNQPLDLNAIVKAFPAVEYRPEQFPGIVFKLKHPKTANLIFSSGKMVCVGAKSEKQANLAIHRIIQQLKDRGILITNPPIITIVNIVASASLGEPIDIEKAAYILDSTMYEPEQFPGLIYRMTNPTVVLLLYMNGKLVVTGAKTEDDVYDAVHRLRTNLQQEHLI